MLIGAESGRVRDPVRVALALLALVAACSSTVDQHADEQGEVPAVGGPAALGPPPSPDIAPDGKEDPPSSEAEETPTLPSSGSSTANTEDSPTPPTAAPPTSGTRTPDSAGPGVPDARTSAAPCPVEARPETPGVTDEEIAIGAPRFRNVAAFMASQGEDAPEHLPDEYIDAMLQHVNATGGVACRQVRIVWHDVDLTDPAVFGPAGEQAMCATWTQDNEVFAAYPGGSDFPYQVLFPCLDRAGVTIIDIRGLEYRDAEALAELPRLVSVAGVAIDRGTTEQVHALVRRGFLTAESRIGVVYYDYPSGRRTVDGALTAALAGYELSLTARAPIAQPSSPADFPAREREVAAAALRFKLDEVDRVLFVRSFGLASNFMNAAERNRYRPRYGLTTIEMRVAHSDDAFAVPPEQLVGSAGVGALPLYDLYPRRPERWPARDRCLAFFGERGFRTATFLDRGMALAVCEAFWFLRAAVEAAPGPLSTETVTAGTAALGDTYESTLVGRTRFGPDRRDGVAVYRDADYDEECGCFVYTSEPHPLP